MGQAYEPRSACPINATIEVFGDRWSLLVLRDIAFGDRRHFRELQANSIEGIASIILADRLRRLVELGLLTREDTRAGQPRGRAGRPSKSLTLDQAKALLAAAERTIMYAYIVVSLFTGARTEELRALTWSHLDLDADPPSIMVWRSVRRGNETKTPKSRRTLELPDRCVTALRSHRRQQAEARLRAGGRWVDLDLVFCTHHGTPLDAANVRRSFRGVARAAGLNADQWTPRELRHSFVSLLSNSGLPIEVISHLVGLASSKVTEQGLPQRAAPDVDQGRTAMDTIFDGPEQLGSHGQPTGVSE